MKSTEDTAIQSKLNELGSLDEEIVGSAQPTQLTDKGISVVEPVLKATLKLFPDQTKGLPLPQAIPVIHSAVNQAISDEVLPDTFECELPLVDDDLPYFAGKLSMLIKDRGLARDFKEWLASEDESPAPPTPEPSERDDFMSKLNTLASREV